MDEQVCGQCRRPLKALATDLTVKAPFLRVHGFVLLQAHRVPEGLAAYLASKGSRAAVGPAHVHLEPVWRGEHLKRLRPGRRTLRGAEGRGRQLRAVRGGGR